MRSVRLRRLNAVNAGRPEGGLAPVLAGAFLFTLVLLFLPASASAYCCANASVASDCCNIFGCNCDGPCTNFGCSAPPRSQDGSCGLVQTYDSCTPDGAACKYCNPGAYADPACALCLPRSSGAAAGELMASKAPATLIVLPTEVASSPRERFKEIDTNHDGKISFEEAKAWFRKTERGASLNEPEVKRLFDALDKNKNGTIEPEELDASLAKH